MAAAAPTTFGTERATLARATQENRNAMNLDRDVTQYVLPGHMPIWHPATHSWTVSANAHPIESNDLAAFRAYAPHGFVLIRNRVHPVGELTPFIVGNHRPTRAKTIKTRGVSFTMPNTYMRAAGASAASGRARGLNAVHVPRAELEGLAHELEDGVDPQALEVVAAMTDSVLRIRNWLIALTQDPRNAPFFTSAAGPGAAQRKWQVRIGLHYQPDEDAIAAADDFHQRSMQRGQNFVVSSILPTPEAAIKQLMGHLLGTMSQYNVVNGNIRRVEFIQFLIPPGVQIAGQGRGQAFRVWHKLFAADVGRWIIPPLAMTAVANCAYHAAILHKWSLQDLSFATLLQQLGNPRARRSNEEPPASLLRNDLLNQMPKHLISHACRLKATLRAFAGNRGLDPALVVPEDHTNNDTLQLLADYYDKPVRVYDIGFRLAAQFVPSQGRRRRWWEDGGEPEAEAEVDDDTTTTVAERTLATDLGPHEFGPKLRWRYWRQHPLEMVYHAQHFYPLLAFDKAFHSETVRAEVRLAFGIVRDLAAVNAGEVAADDLDNQYGDNRTAIAAFASGLPQRRSVEPNQIVRPFDLTRARVPKPSAFRRSTTMPILEQHEWQVSQTTASAAAAAMEFPPQGPAVAYEIAGGDRALGERANTIGPFSSLRVGAFDLEAYVERFDEYEQPRFVVYAAGFAWRQVGDEVHDAADPENRELFARCWIGKGLDAIEQMLRHWAELIETGHMPDIVIAHNGGRFDFVLLMPFLLQNRTWPYFRLYDKGCICSHQRWLRLELEYLGADADSFVSDAAHPKRRRIVLLDSYPIFQASLAAITSQFKVPHQKLVDLVDHADIRADNWALAWDRCDLERYLRHDVLGLWESYIELSRRIAIETTQRVNLFDQLTAAMLAKSWYKTCFYERVFRRYPLFTLPKPVKQFIMTGYRGGIVHCGVVGPVGLANAFDAEASEIVAHPNPPFVYPVDVVSLYPYIATGDLPTGVAQVIAGAAACAELWTVHPLTGEYILKPEVYGYVRVQFWYPDAERYHRMRHLSRRFPVHATIHKNRLVYGWVTEEAQVIEVLTSNEIRYWQQTLPGFVRYRPAPDAAAGDIGAVLFRPGPILRDYMLEHAASKQKARAEGRSVDETIFKMLMNSLIGGLGKNAFEKDTVSLVSMNQYAPPVELNQADQLLVDGRLINFAVYENVLNQRTIMLRALVDLPESEWDAIAVASWVTAEGRLLWLQARQAAVDGGAHVLYGDTDSLHLSMSPSAIPALRNRFRVAHDRLHSNMGRVDVNSRELVDDPLGQTLGCLGNDAIKPFMKAGGAACVQSQIEFQHKLWDTLVAGRSVQPELFTESDSLEVGWPQAVYVGPKVYSFRSTPDYNVLQKTLSVSHAKGVSGEVSYADMSSLFVRCPLLAPTEQSVFESHLGDCEEYEARRQLTSQNAIMREQQFFSSGARAALEGAREGRMPGVSLVRIVKKLRCTATKYEIDAASGWTFPLLLDGRTHPRQAPYVPEAEGEDPLDALFEFEEPNPPFFGTSNLDTVPATPPSQSTTQEE